MRPRYRLVCKLSGLFDVLRNSVIKKSKALRPFLLGWFVSCAIMSRSLLLSYFHKYLDPSVEFFGSKNSIGFDDLTVY